MHTANTSPWRSTLMLAALLIVPLAASRAADPPPVTTQPTANPLSSADAGYLHDLAADTWACIAHFVDPTTGLPCDNSDRAEFTSVSNLGLYAAACGVAKELRLIDADDATQRVRRVLDAYRRFKKWHGFSQSWNSIHTLEPSPNDTMISVLDSGNMLAGFIVAAQALPDVRADVDRILADTDWAAVYDADRKLLFGGYDLARGRLDPGWHIGAYATDGRMAAFLAIAAGAAPPESWDALERATETHYDLTIYRPAWAGGGLFMQALHGIFLDERTTPIGRSIADFAYAQMIYAQQFDLPLWGWSACLAPDGRYLGWGGLETPVVTPHAVGLTAFYYPHKAVECFQRLERFGVRQPYVENGRTFKFGFSDSVNLESRAVQRKYLPPLDQGMLFLSLANTLEDRIVQRLFESHPLIKRGRQLIPEYAAPTDPTWLTELRRRDAAPLPTPPATTKTGPETIVIDDAGSVWTRDANDPTVTISVTPATAPDADAHAGGLRVTYDVESAHPAYGGVTFDLHHADATGCRALELTLRGVPDTLKVELHGQGGTGVTYVTGIAPDRWTQFRIPFPRFGGLISDWSDLERLILVFEDSRSRPKTGTLDINNIRLTR